MEWNVKVALAIAVAFIAIGVFFWWWAASVPPAEPRSGMRTMAVNVDSCDAQNNELTIRNVGDIDIEPREVKVYYFESGEYTGLSGFITELFPQREVVNVQLEGGSLESGERYFVVVTGSSSAQFTC